MDKLKLHSPDFTDENVKKLAELFPDCVTENKDDKGNIKKSIDFDQLRQELSKNIVEGPQERYSLNWPGKREALLQPTGADRIRLLDGRFSAQARSSGEVWVF